MWMTLFTWMRHHGYTHFYMCLSKQTPRAFPSQLFLFFRRFSPYSPFILFVPYYLSIWLEISYSFSHIYSSRHARPYAFIVAILLVVSRNWKTLNLRDDTTQMCVFNALQSDCVISFTMDNVRGFFSLNFGQFISQRSKASVSHHLLWTICSWRSTQMTMENLIIFNLHILAHLVFNQEMNFTEAKWQHHLVSASQVAAADVCIEKKFATQNQLTSCALSDLK